jgi:predicted PurR-regulated permease PerM
LQVFLFALAIILLYVMLQPVITIFLTSIILTYIFYPLYKKIRGKIKRENLSVFLTLILTIVIFLMPFVFILSQIPNQTTQIYNFAQTNILGKGFFDFTCETSETLKCKSVNFAVSSGFFDLEGMIDIVLSKAMGIVKSIIVGIPNMVVAIAVSLFISFFLFKDGQKMLRAVVEMMPMNKKYANRLVDQFGKVTFSVVYAHIIVALVQGALGGIAFYFVGIQSPIFWGIVMAVFALLPFVGSAIVWVPASILMLVNGIISNSYFIIGKAIGLALFGILIISTVDNILRVKIAGGRGGVHPLTVLVGLIGGVNLFGLIGIFVGPIVLSLLLTFFKDFSANYRS